MDTDFSTDEFVALVEAGGGRKEALASARDLRTGTPLAPFHIAALCLSVATTAPESLVEIYDALTEGWLGRAPVGPRVSGTPEPTRVTNDVWSAIWELVFDPDAGRDPADITVRTALVTGLQPREFHERVAAMSVRYPDVAAAAAAGLPPKFELADIAKCPPGSLGGRLNSLVMDKGFDLEVLDRDSLGLQELPPPLDYVNVRILQCHDIWHEVAGYDTTGLHEVAISGFQMAQFGHHYSSMFLGIVLTKVAFTQPIEGTSFLLDTILTAYLHGRETPPLMNIEWEKIWDRPMGEIRETIGVSTYDSPYPAGILEEMRNGTVESPAT